ncbi:MAG: hypothetical protein CVU97_05175 [Firmicutes bacterium HGW-Firmicutes-21]|nr:MAG: hypothetical protein CVU97_05175 [Firmicutes bacterium HGW-Firmicutes-21]
MRIFAFILLVSVLSFTLTSCSVLNSDLSDVKSMLAYPVRVSAIIEQETVIKFNANVFEDETIFTFNEPSTLSLLTVKKNNDGYFAQFDGIETKIDHSGITAADALDIALETIRASETCEKQNDDGQNVLLFSIDGNNVLVYYDSEKGIINKIKSEAYGQLFSYEIMSVESINT